MRSFVSKKKKKNMVKNDTTESKVFPIPKCESDLDMLRMCLKGK